MRMFRLFGEGTRHLTRGVAKGYRIWQRYVKLDCCTEEAAVADYRKKKLDLFDWLQKRGITAKDAADGISDVSLATLYRWRGRYRRWGLQGLVNESRARHRPPPRRARTPEVKEAIFRLRQEHTWGKLIICEILRRAGISVGSTTVGKIISELLASGKITSGHAGKWAKARRRFTGCNAPRSKPPAMCRWIT